MFKVRERKLLKRLLLGPVWREEIDKLMPMSNGPHVIYLLRKMGFEIHCERVPTTNRNGNVCYPGLYSLTSDDRQKAIEFLAPKTPTTES